ncbi:hypothetical protein D1872_296630 [compost metagenome]
MKLAFEQERSQPQPDRRDTDRYGDRTHDFVVAFRNHGGAEHERYLIDRSAHIERDHRPQDQSQQNGTCSLHPGQPVGQHLKNLRDRTAEQVNESQTDN